MSSGPCRLAGRWPRPGPAPLRLGLPSAAVAPPVPRHDHRSRRLAGWRRVHAQPASAEVPRRARSHDGRDVARGRPGRLHDRRFRCSRTSTSASLTSACSSRPSAMPFAPVGNEVPAFCRPDQLIRLVVITHPQTSSPDQADTYASSSSVRPTSPSRSLTAWTAMSRWWPSNTAPTPLRYPASAPWSTVPPNAT